MKFSQKENFEILSNAPLRKSLHFGQIKEAFWNHVPNLEMQLTFPSEIITQ